MIPRNPFKISRNKKDLVPVVQDSPLPNLPDDLIRYIGSYLDADAGRYVQACKTINHFFQPDLSKVADQLVADALHCAAFGKKDELEEMLKKRPRLAYKRGWMMDPCGRQIYGTVYRIALAAKDVSMGEHEEMVEMIERYVKKIPDGAIELERQVAEQFPKGWEKKEEIRKKKDSKELRKVNSAIHLAKKFKDCEKAIEKFINYLQSQNRVETGYYFNEKLLNEALKLLDDQYDKDGYAYYYNDIRLTQISWIQTYILDNIKERMPVCLAQAYCCLYSVTIKKEPLNRNLVLSNGTVFYSHHSDANNIAFSFSDEARSWLNRARELLICLLRAKTVLLVKRHHCTFTDDNNERPKSKLAPVYM